MSGCRREVVKQARRPIDIRDHDIHASIVIEIGERRPAILSAELKIGAGGGGNVRKPAILIAEDAVRQRSGRADDGLDAREMGVRGKNVLPPVIVEIVETYAPAGETAGRNREGSAGGHVFESRTLTGIVKQGKQVVVHGGDDEVGTAIVVEVTKIGAHAGDRAFDIFSSLLNERIV